MYVWDELFDIINVIIYTTGKKYGIFLILAIFCIFVQCAGRFCT